MKLLLISLITFAASNLSCSQEKPYGARSMESIYKYTFNNIEGKTINLKQFKGQKILIVNVASKCGFTSQYEELEILNRKFKDTLIIIGFPSNDFMNQEPGTNEEIAAFCKTKFDVTFLLSEKISVKKGKDQHEIYKWLTNKSLNGWNEQAPKWNFYKYLIDENGELTNVFPSTTNPMNKEITDAIIK